MTQLNVALLGLIRLLDILNGEDVASGLWVVLEVEPLVVDEQRRPGRDGEGLPLATEPHPQDRVLLPVLDGAGQLNVAAYKKNCFFRLHLIGQLQVVHPRDWGTLDDKSGPLVPCRGQLVLKGFTALSWSFTAWKGSTKRFSRLHQLYYY